MSNQTPAKKAKVEKPAKSEAMTPKEEMITPARRLKMDLALTPSSTRSQKKMDKDFSLASSPELTINTSPAASSVSAQVDAHQDDLEKFWASAGVEAASEIASKLASAAIKLAAQFTLSQMELSRRADNMAGLGRIGWPTRKLPGELENSLLAAAGEVPASWRVSGGLSRRAVALATPPRFKRKFEAEPVFHDVFGISGISALNNQSAAERFNSELRAVHKLDARKRVSSALERKERLARRLRRQLREARANPTREEDEMSSSPLRDYEDHYGHGCEFDDRSSTTTEDEGPTPAANINNGAVNVNIMCPH